VVCASVGGEDAWEVVLLLLLLLSGKASETVDASGRPRALCRRRSNSVTCCSSSCVVAVLIGNGRVSYSNTLSWLSLFLTKDVSMLLFEYCGPHSTIDLTDLLVVPTYCWLHRHTDKNRWVKRGSCN
jgi:hypothetical protein